MASDSKRIEDGGLREVEEPKERHYFIFGRDMTVDDMAAAITKMHEKYYGPLPDHESDS